MSSELPKFVLLPEFELAWNAQIQMPFWWVKRKRLERVRESKKKGVEIVFVFKRKESNVGSYDG